MQINSRNTILQTTINNYNSMFLHLDDTMLSSIRTGKDTQNFGWVSENYTFSY